MGNSSTNLSDAKIDIVSTNKRSIIDSHDIVSIYIPMTKEEIKAFNIKMNNPCWKIILTKHYSL